MLGGRRLGPSAWLWLTLAACGGRTLDEGAYDTPGSSGTSDGTCSYNGVTVANGTLVADPCVCFCDSGRFQCQVGCDSPGSSSGGAGVIVGGGGPIGAGAPSVAGAAGAPAAGAGGASSAGAGAASGGAVGVAGGPAILCGPALRAIGQAPLIDDMEDGNGAISMFEGRRGAWFTYGDGTGMLFPPPSTPSFPMEYAMDPLSSGRYVASVNGGGFTTWGAGMGLVLSNGCPYDASVYKGVRFFARADHELSLNVLFPTADTNPPSSGGTCQELTGHSCFDAYQVQTTLSAAWQTFEFDFAELTQQGWGQPVVFDQKKLIGINFQISNEAGSFTVKVDDVSFY